MARLGPFTVDELLGRGGMGEVWSGHHVDFAQPVAIKVITARQSDSERYRAAFTDEVRAVAGLRHRGVIEVFDYGLAQADGPFGEGSPYLVMARADGSVRGQPPAGWVEVRALLLEVLDALAHAHAHGVVHLDIKPGNLLRVGGRVVLSDFGVATFLGEAVSRDAVRGSAAYMAPEQFVGRWRDYCPATDLYALGTAAWEMLCGDVPFLGTDPTTLGNMKRTSPPPRIPDAIAPPALRHWLDAMLATDVGDRFQRAADAAAALEAIPPEAPVRLGQATIRADSTIALSTLADDVFATPEPAPISVIPASEPQKAPVRDDWRASGTRTDLLREALGLGLFGLRPPPFVGRLPERDRLWRMVVESARTRRPGLALVHGPQGMGATRLCTWIARRADELGMAVALVREPEEEEGDFWRRALLLDGMEVDEAVSQLVLGRARLPEELARAVAALVAPGSEVEARASLAIQVELIEAVSRTRPVVWVVDRLDAAGRNANLAVAVLARVRGPVVVLVTARSESLGDELEGQRDRLEKAGGAVVGLEPLGDEDVRAMIHRLLRLQGEVAALLVERASGNPQEVVRHLGAWIDAGLLQPGPSGFVLAEDRALTDPSWEERVAPLLEGEAGRAVELAAVIGPTVEREVWERVVGLELGALIGVEEALIRRQLARAVPGGFQFSHPAIRRAVLAVVEREGRKVRHHGRVAEVLQALGPQYAHRVGRHLFEGERWSEAVDALLTTVLPLWNRRHIDRVRAAIAMAKQAAERTGSPLLKQRCQVVEAYFALNSGRLDEAGPLAEELLQTLGEGPEADRIRGRAYRVRGTMRQRQGRIEEGIADLEEASRLLVSVGDDNLACTARATWMQGLLQLGRYEEARKVAATLHPVEGHTQVMVEGALGILHSYLYEWDAAIEHLGRALEQARARGMRVAEAGIVSNLGDAWRHQGDLVRAEHYADYAIGLARTLGLAGEPIMRLNHVQLLLALGDPDRAWEVLESALSGLERLGRKAMYGAAHAVALRVVAERGDWERWDHHFEQSQELLAGSGMAEPEIAEAYERAAELAEEVGLIRKAEQARAAADAQRAGIDDRSPT